MSGTRYFEMYCNSPSSSTALLLTAVSLGKTLLGRALMPFCNGAISHPTSTDFSSLCGVLLGSAPLSAAFHYLLLLKKTNLQFF